jgi:hypothetical protein
VNTCMRHSPKCPIVRMFFEDVLYDYPADNEAYTEQLIGFRSVDPFST